MLKIVSWRFCSVVMVVMMIAAIGGSVITPGRVEGGVCNGWSDDFSGGAHQTWVTIDGGNNSTHVFQNNRYELHTESTDGSAKFLASYVNSSGSDYVMQTRIQRILAGDNFLPYLLARANTSTVSAYVMGASSDGSHFWFGKLTGGVYSSLTPDYIEATTFNPADFQIKFALVGNKLYGKVWTTGTTEPDHWQITMTNSSYSSGVGGVLLATYPTLSWNTVQVAFKQVSLTCLSQSTVYVDAAWTGKINGNYVALPGGGTGIIGYNAFATIQNGVDGVTSGGTVNVAAGTYNLASNSPINVNKAVTLTGDVTNPSNVVVKAPLSGDWSGRASCFVVSENNVTIQGFRIQDALDLTPSGKQNMGIWIGHNGNTEVYKLHDININHNEITNCSHGIMISWAYNVQATYNKIWNMRCTAPGTYSGGKGIVAYGDDHMLPDNPTNILIDHNEIHDCAFWGILLDMGSYSAWSSTWYNLNTTISNNAIYNNGGSFDNYGPGTNYDAGYGIATNAHTTGVTVENNAIYGHITGIGTRLKNNASGIKLTADKGWTIRNNDIHDNFRGIYIYGKSTSPFNYGLTDENTAHLLTNNNLYDNAQGLVVDRQITDGYAQLNTITNNNVATWTANGYSPYGILNLYVIGSGNPFNAMNNWWGANDGPRDIAFGHGDKVSANVTYSPWMVLNLNTNPVSIPADGVATSAIKADMTKNSDNLTTGGFVPDGTEIIFTTTSGSIGSLTTTKTTTSGIAIATLTSSAIPGTATVTASAPGDGTYAKVVTTVTFSNIAPKQARTPDGQIVSVTVNSGTLANFTIQPDTNLSEIGRPPMATFPYGVFSFNITNLAPGATVILDIDLPFAPSENIQYWKYQNNIWTDCSSLCDDLDGDMDLMLVLTDGGPGDADGIANGIIIDPGAPLEPSNPRLFTNKTHGSSMPAVTIPQAPVALPNILVKSAAISSSSRVTAEVTNLGTASGSSRIVLSVDGKPSDSQVVSLAPGNTTTVYFDVSKIEPGTHDIVINNIPAGRITVPGESYTLLIIGIIFILVVVSGLFYHFRKQRAE